MNNKTLSELRLDVELLKEFLSIEELMRSEVSSKLEEVSKLINNALKEEEK